MYYSRLYQEKGETHLKVESNRITRLGCEAPEESVALICPHQTVVLVMLDWGFWERNVFLIKHLVCTNLFGYAQNPPPTHSLYLCYPSSINLP